MPLFNRNVSEPILPGTVTTSAPPMETSFSYSHHMSPSIASDSGSAAESPSVSAFNPAEHLTELELENTIITHQNLINAASVYREQAEKLATAAADLGSALELVAKEKAAMDSGTGLQAAAGLQFLISNHHLLLVSIRAFDLTLVALCANWYIMQASTISTAFEEPLVDNLERHKDSIQQSQQNFENVVRTMNQKISDTELRSLQNTNKKRRDLRQFRRVLQELTQQIDELETVKIDYSRYVFETEKRNHQFILSKVSGLVRAQVDVYERISNKGLGEPTLEHMFLSNPDPFCAYPTSDESKAIFSVLPPISLIDAAISSGQDSLMVYGPDVNSDQEPPPISPPKNEQDDVSAIDKVEASLTTDALNSPQLDTERHHIMTLEEDDIKIQRATEEEHDDKQEVTPEHGVRTDYTDDASWQAI
ncbi:hypothetical protein INT43_000609 [Umbelopsis isabellina]|uniref:Uncharacterized protein n=1 Tax=Mortierella isabellina TaxID=91625 RepID=A0A8H7Q4T8_MORIS|nr:hypothetical protein INT43_000609 [Umbelopsis isabellina]